MTIKIDFHGSTHGHFLEYVANVYIMQTPKNKDSIFKPPTFSAHNRDYNYLTHRMIFCGHFSEANDIDNDDIIIRISPPATDNSFFIATTNLMYKAGDVGFEKQMLSIPESVRNDPVACRNDWYSKFNEREKYINYYYEFAPVLCKLFEFPFESFFSFKEFCSSLSLLADFLEQTFFLDSSLYDLWAEFMSYNQGWNSHNKCNIIFENIFAKKNNAISCSVLEQSWLNYNLSKICKIYQGPMFDEADYPSTTGIIYSSVQDQLSGRL